MMQVLVNGAISGLSIALLGVAFNAVYLPTRIMHLALAAIFVLVPHIVWQMQESGFAFSLSIFAAILAGATASILCEVANHWRIERKKSSFGAHFVSSLGIYIFVSESIALRWGTDPKHFRSSFDTAIVAGPVLVSSGQVITAIGSGSVLIAFYLFLKKTGVGLLFRGIAENPVEMALHGHNVQKLRLLAFGIAGFLASVSGLLIGNDVGFSPHGGLHALLVAVVAVIVGGHSFWLGPVVGGFFVGLIKSQATWHFSQKWADAACFLFLALILYFRPTGLMGSHARHE